MAKIVIDGETYEVNPENNLLQECLSQGLDLPYFCWHPSMGSVGACRQCAVKQYRDENDQKGLIMMACMTPVKDGNIFSIKDEEVRYFRQQVIESLMISHPHDCPVCEEGGECHLQDMTQMSGHNYRRYDRNKVTHRNQYLGPFLNHEMNRCITCYRCVRFYQDYAGGTDLVAMAAHHHVYFGRHEEGVLENEFSGNLVEVCPTGVFTDKPFSEHYTRKWDLQTAPSVCASCSVGCNTTPGERYGSLRRLVNRYHPDINGYFLCDRGRFGYGFINSDTRIKQASYGNLLDAEVKDSSTGRDAITSEEALLKLKELTSSGTTIGIGSPRASIESNFALREKVGAENFYSGYADIEHEIFAAILEFHGDPLFHCPSIKEVEQADAILIIGEDVTNTAPRIALALRQSVRNAATELAKADHIPVWQDAAVRELAQSTKSPLHILSGYATRLDDIASTTINNSIDYLTMATCALARILDERAPQISSSHELDTDHLLFIAEDLRSARRPLIICGSACGSVALVEAAANLGRALFRARQTMDKSSAVDLCLVMPEVNSMGLAVMQCGSKNNLGSALQKMRDGSVNAVIVIENDLFRRAPAEQVKSALSAVKSLIVMDQIDNETVARAQLVLPVTSFAEQEGSHVNYEGRVQLSYQVYVSDTDSKPGWKWLALENCSETNSDVATSISNRDVAGRCAQKLESFSDIVKLFPAAGNFVANMKVPRQLHRYSGRTAMLADKSVHEPKQTQDHDSVMAFSMEGISSMKNSNILASSWAPAWNSNQSITKFQQEVGGELAQARDDVFLLTRHPEQGDYLTPRLQDNQHNQDAYQRIPINQIFGSDELSAQASAIKHKLLPAYACLSIEDANMLGLGGDDGIEIGGGDLPSYQLPVIRRSSMHSGTVAIYDGVNEINSRQLGWQVQIKKANNCGSVALFENENLLIADKDPQGVN